MFSQNKNITFVDNTDYYMYNGLIINLQDDKFDLINSIFSNSINQLGKSLILLRSGTANLNNNTFLNNECFDCDGI